jgi:crotonobetainyl-CoA:carnitine CoA-transferase CaiB-like acyl-CoA transferase
MNVKGERAVPHRLTPTRGPLTGIRVVELADEQAEYCGLTLAGLGADVVKVEPPGGSPTRRIGPFTRTGKIPSAPCSSGSTTAASARSCWT